MWTREQWRQFEDKPGVQTFFFILGIVLMLAAIPIGALPGPGGLFVFVPGLALTLRSSMWAKRHYVKFKRWQPKAGRWTDWGLRRASAKRREELAKARREEEKLAEEPNESLERR
ncbi:hypothetical protein H9L12_06040 [Sphingomonas rhizophila]|uniref:TIGR02611 family protein n=1 Tax=Sphingomonas rhizophila TaxID=2071607 RepID=A0A7G9SDX2_9SPHN|nr:hypothetical protein [Sphingomonas rhizophila]QNN66047.1 hypothetical protein H9L12_06040 [Sphingomonas rhizophila]